MSVHSPPARIVLTEARVAGFTAPEQGRKIVYDLKVPEFGVRITPKGVRSYIVRKKVNRRAEIVTLGRYPSLTVEKARKIASEILGDIAGGKDPAEQKRIAKSEETLGTFWKEYLKRHAKVKKRTWKSDETRWELYLKPWSNRRLSTITSADVSSLHARIGRTNGQIAANRLLSLISRMFSLARKWGAAVENPAIGIDRFKEIPRQRFLNTDELSRLGKALDKVELEATEKPEVIAALRLLLLTGARYSEILGLRWEWVDIDEGHIRLPTSKTGFKVVHLNTPARDILGSLPRKGEWVLPGAKEGKHLVNLQKPWRRIRSAANLDDVKIHDLRHSFASMAVAGGLSLYVTGALLGHTQPQTTARYAHLDADPLKQAAEIIGQQVTDAWGEGAAKEGSKIELPTKPK